VATFPRRHPTAASHVFSVLAQAAIKDVDRMASSHGHIVLRVSPGGNEYHVTIVDDTTESRNVTKICGPYRSR
jgi:hypothetical protein